MSRKWFLVLPLLVIGLLLFQNTLVFKGLQWSLERSFAANFGGQLEWESIEHIGSTVVLHSPRVVKGEERPFVADQMTLHWDIQLLNRTLVIEAELVRPEWKMDVKQIDLFRAGEGGLQLFKLRGALKIVEGLVDLPGGPAEVNLDMGNLYEKKIELALKQGEAHFFLSGGHERGYVEATHFPLPILSDFIETLAPSLTEGRVLRGSLDGHFAYHLSPQFRPEIEGSLSLDNLVIHGMRKNFQIEVPHLTAQMRPNLEGEVILGEGARIEWGKGGPRPFVGEHLSGILRLHADEKADFTISGTEIYRGEPGPLVAGGKLDFHHFELDLNYLSHESAFTLHGADGKFELSVQNFGVQQFSLMDAALKKLAPGINPIDFREGRVDAKLTAAFSKEKLGLVSIDHLALSNLACHGWGADFGAKTVSGRLVMDLSDPHPTETLNTELLIVNGFVDLVTDIETRLVVKQGVIEKSQASINLAGLKGRAEIDWQSRQNPLQVHFKGYGADLARFLPPRIRSGMERTLARDPITLNLAMQKEGSLMRFQGDLMTRGLSNLATFGFDIKPEGKEVGLFGFWVDNGWIKGDEIPLETFVSPYLFKQDDIVLSGNADLVARFDFNGLSVAYTGHDVVLESDKVKITMKEVPGRVRGELLAEHTVNFATGVDSGVLPLERATYLDKTKGLLFTQIDGDALFQEKKILFPHLTASSFDLNLVGSVLVDNTDERVGYFDVWLDIDRIEGELKGVAQMLEKIDPSLNLSSSSFNGQVHLNEEGGKFSFHVEKERSSWDGKVFGSVSQGTFYASKDIALNFAFDKGADLFMLSDVSGGFFLEEEYSFLIDQIGFNKLSERQGVFNVQVFDPEGELFRLTGSTQIGADEHLHFTFDRALTHFREVRPTAIELKTRDLSAIEYFKLDLNFDLRKIFSSLEMLEGEVESHFHYDSGTSRFIYDLKGKGIAIKGRELKEVSLSGDYQEGVWRVKEGKADDLSFSLDAIKKKNTWLLEHLGVKIGDSLLLGLEGAWEEGSPSFQARVNLLEVALESLSEFNELVPFVDEFKPKGILKGSGALTIGKNEEGDFAVEASFTTRFKNIQLKGLQFQDLEPSTFQFVMGQGVQLRNLKTALLSTEGQIPIVDLFIEKIAIDFRQDDIEIENLKYSLPSINLPWLASTLEAVFPEVMTPFLTETIATLKTDGIAAGALHFKFREGGHAFKATLADGPWHLLGWDAELRGFLLEIDDDELKISMEQLIDNQLVWVLSRTPLPLAETGVVVIADGEQSITLYWEKHPDKGLVIKEAKGSALGLTLALEEDNSDSAAFRLKGEVGLDLSRSGALFSPTLKELFGKGWGLSGRYHIAKELVDGERPYHFIGELHGKECEIKGCTFDTLHAQLEATHNTFSLTNLLIHDPSGMCRVDEARFNRTSQWVAKIPKIEITDLRPSLLLSDEPKPLVIRSLVIHDLNGPINPSTGLKGSGQLTFVNPVKKNLHNTIFALPAEILSRIGVDLIALTPVRGQIHFQIINGMVLFTKFKDVYSDGKLSKFYLAGGRTPSYMDFDGSLHLQIKMKQYTLLFKLAELFTFNIGGTLAKPIYSVQKS